MSVDLSALDPGIRNTVALLRGWGFQTTDSGDGVTKPAAGWTADEAETVPHVHIKSERGLVVHADLLRDCLAGIGIRCSPVGQGDCYIQATYDPANGSGFVALYGVDDAMLRKAGI